MAIDYIDNTNPEEEEEFVNKEMFVSAAQDKELQTDDETPETETVDLSKIKTLAKKYKEKKEKQKSQTEEKKEFLNTNNDNTDKEKENNDDADKNKEVKENSENPVENDEKENTKETKNNSVEEIVLPKGFEYLLDIVKQYNKVLKLVKNPDFVQNVLQKAIEKRIEEKSEEIAESFAEKTIQELEKSAYFEIAEEKKELEFIADTDINECEMLNIIAFDKTEFKKKIMFNPDYIYDFYFKIINSNNNNTNKETVNNYKEIFEFLKNQGFFVEDYFII